MTLYYFYHKNRQHKEYKIKASLEIARMKSLLVSQTLSGNSQEREIQKLDAVFAEVEGNETQLEGEQNETYEKDRITIEGES